MTALRRAHPGTAATAGPAASGGTLGGRARWRLWLLAVATVTAIAAWSLLGSPFFTVRTVTVTGTGSSLSRAQVLAAAAVPPGLPLIRLDGAAVAARVERLTQVQSATVSADWPSAVTIAVRTRTPMFSVAVRHRYLVTDGFGVVLASGRQPAAGLPLLTASGGLSTAQLRGNPAVRIAARVLAEFPRQLARRVVSVSVGAGPSVSATLAGGAVVVWGSPADGRLKARVLAVLMTRAARYYDVSNPGVAVTRG